MEVALNWSAQKAVAPAPCKVVLTVKVSTLVVVAKRVDRLLWPLTLREESKVELARTKMPAVLEVGVKALVNSNSQAPGEPAPELASVPQ